MSVHTVKDTDDLKEQLEKAVEKLVVIDFYATWCGPCKMIAPALQQMAMEMEDKVLFLKVDVDVCEDIAMEYKVTAMPTFVLLKSNKKLEEFSGANETKLRELILKHA